MPLARQANILARHDIDIPRNTLARWHVLTADRMQPLIKRFEAASSQSYMWVRRGLSSPDDTGQRRDVTLYPYSAWLAHAWRKFVEAAKALPKGKKKPGDHRHLERFRETVRPRKR